MNPLLKRHFSNFKQKFDIAIPEILQEKEKQLQESKAFEKFVNNTVLSYDYPETFTPDANLLNFVSIGGGNDTGIDGIAIVVNQSIIRSIDDINVILQEKNKKIEYDFVFIQSKMQTKFEASEFNTFAIGVEHFLSKESTLPENEQLKEFRKIKEFLDSDEIIKRIRRNPNISLYYVTTGNPPTDQHFIGTRDIIEKKFKQSSYYFNEVSIKLIDGNSLIDYCDELENNFQVKLNILDTLPLLVGDNAEIKKAHVFTCTALEYLKILMKNEDGSLRKHLFNDNVRDYLGNREGSVNNEIEKSIVQNPEMFLLCNNGVTIVCSDFNPIKDKLVQIDNPQIVNGCQTSSTIFRQKDNINIGKIKLLVKLICTDDSKITNQIVRGTNKQNQVLEESFESTLPFHQDKLEPFFLSIDKGPRLYYERRAKQYNDSSIKRSQIVNLRIISQAFTSIFLISPHNSYRHEKIILELFGGEIDKRKIFRNDHSEYPYYAAAAIWNMFENYIYKPQYKHVEPYKNHLYLIFRESFREELPKLSKGYKIENYCNKLIDFLNNSEFEKRLPETIQLFETVREKWIEKGGSPHGIKDNKGFTELLLSVIKDKYYAERPLPVTKDSKVFKGEILRIINNKKKLWHSFIESPEFAENIYFDSRSFNGSFTDLKPKLKVEFEIIKTNTGRTYANKVEIKS